MKHEAVEIVGSDSDFIPAPCEVEASRLLCKKLAGLAKKDARNYRLPWYTVLEARDWLRNDSKTAVDRLTTPRTNIRVNWETWLPALEFEWETLDEKIVKSEPRDKAMCRLICKQLDKGGKGMLRADILFKDRDRAVALLWQSLRRRDDDRNKQGCISEVMKTLSDLAALSVARGVRQRATIAELAEVS